MTSAKINPGVCGLLSRVEAEMTGDRCAIRISSDCASIQELARHLTEVDPLNEISFRGSRPETLALAEKYCAHASCVVPVGILKAIEVEAGLALPQSVSIEVCKEGKKVNRDKEWV